MNTGKTSHPTKKNKSCQVKDAIKQVISQPERKHGDVLPSERELGEQYKVSRITIRRALAELESEGLIYRIQGKGAFISKSKLPQNLTRLTSYSQDMEQRSLVPGSMILSFDTFIANSTISAKLEIEANETVFLLRRLRLANDEPTAIENCYLPKHIGEAVAQNIANNVSLYKIFRGIAGIQLSRAEQTIEVGYLQNWEKKLLGPDCPTAALCIKRQTFDTTDRVVEYVESKYRSDRYIFHVEMSA